MTEKEVRELFKKTTELMIETACALELAEVRFALHKYEMPTGHGGLSDRLRNLAQATMMVDLEEEDPEYGPRARDFSALSSTASTLGAVIAMLERAKKRCDDRFGKERDG